MMTCFECGNESLRPAKVDMPGERNGQAFTVFTDGYKCGICGFQTLDSEQSEAFTRLLSDAYRNANGLLTSAEIRGLRAGLDMTQNDFAAFLGVGVASVRRWELGQIQDKAMDELMRLKTDLNTARLNVKAIADRVMAMPGHRIRTKQVG